MDFRALVEQHQVWYWQILDDLVRLETVSPPGRNTGAVQNYIEQFARSLGASVHRWPLYPGDDLLVADFRGEQADSGPVLILNGHVDVATVGDGNGWQHPPFRLTRAGDTVYGRGVADMKGGMAAALFALRLLYDQGIRFPGVIRLQSVIGEEAGEAGTRAVLERGYTGDFAICMDTSNLAVQGQGGCITGWITVRSRQVFHDAVRHQMIHPGGSVRGASAIEKMQAVLTELRSLEDIWYQTKSYPGFARGVNTINPAVIEGGRNAAFVADVCRLWVTVHFYPDERYEDVTAEIERHLGALSETDRWFRENPLSFEWGGKSMLVDRGEIFPSAEVDARHPAVRRLLAAHRAVTGQDAVCSMNPSVTDAGWLAHAGIPTVLYGPGDPAVAHAADEFAPAAQLLDYAAVLMTFLTSGGASAD